MAVYRGICTRTMNETVITSISMVYFPVQPRKWSLNAAGKPGLDNAHRHPVVNGASGLEPLFEGICCRFGYLKWDQFGGKPSSLKVGRKQAGISPLHPDTCDPSVGPCSAVNDCRKRRGVREPVSIRGWSSA